MKTDARRGDGDGVGKAEARRRIARDASGGAVASTERERAGGWNMSGRVDERRRARSRGESANSADERRGTPGGAGERPTADEWRRWARRRRPRRAAAASAGSSIPSARGADRPTLAAEVGPRERRDGELAAEERRLLAHRAVEEAPPPRALDQLGEPLVAERRVLAARVEPPGAHPRLERVEATELGLQLAELLLVRGVARAQLPLEEVALVA